MSSIQERLQLKREPLDKWSIREQLCLASAVARSGDQNWMSVSRALKPFGELNRPIDWFHQKNCAAQYGALLSNVETPKRKKSRTSTGGEVVETPPEIIMKRLLAERIAELKKVLAEEKTEYQQLKQDLTQLQSGNVSEDQLDIWCKEIDDEERLQEQQAAEHQRWLREREMRKQEIERVWRPAKPATFSSPSQKRKSSDTFEEGNPFTESDDSSSRGESEIQVEDYVFEEFDECSPVNSLIPLRPKARMDFILAGSSSSQPQSVQQQQLQQQYLQLQAAQEQNKQPVTSTSPLLTSLLKSPSQVQNMIQQSTSSILHTAITSQSPQQRQNQNSTIASLLNSSANLQVSQGLQNLVASAITQDPQMKADSSQQLTGDLLDDEKIDDLANSILEDQDGPLPEIKKEEVDDIISEIIDSAHDIVTDPEQHLQLDGNGDLNLDLELDGLDEEEMPEAETPQPEVIKDESTMTEHPPLQDKPIEEKEPEIPIPKTPEKAEVPKEKEKLTPETPKTPKSTPPVVDPFEFQEDDPVIFDPKPTLSKQDSSAPYTPLYQQQPYVKVDEKRSGEKKEPDKQIEISPEVSESDEKVVEPAAITSRHLPGSVEIVEVIGDDDNSETELNESQIQDIVHSLDTNIAESQPDPEKIQDEVVDEVKEIKEEIKEEPKDEDVDDVQPLPLDEPAVPEKTTDSASEVETKTEETPSTKEEPDDPKTEEKAEVDVKVEEDEEEESKIDDLYDINMEVKIDKTGKTKRDYSRTKRNQDKSFDVLLAIEKAQFGEIDLIEETQSSDNTVDSEKKEAKPRLKSENERSNSPWTTEEEEHTGAKGNIRRLSTPGTPMESYPNSPASSTFYDHDDKDYRNWKKSVMLVYNRLASNKYASLFLKPITEEQAPGYKTMVYRPMDLQTIKKNIDNGTIRTSLEFKRDVMLMFQNAIMYNKTYDTIYNMAVQMQQESLEPIDILLQAQADAANAPSRRETRTSESSNKRKRPAEDNSKNKKKKED